MKAFVVALLVCATPAAAAPVWDAPRLPRTFEPARYRLRLAIDATTKLAGHVEIDGALATATQIVWLDFIGDVTKADAVVAGKATRLKVVRVGDRIALEAPLGAGPVTLALDFVATIDDEGKVVLADDGKQRDMLAEQMAAQRSAALGAFRQTVDGQAYTFTSSEPMDARRIFPCIDEPDRKVPWEVTLDVAADLVAAGNAPIVKETPLPDGRKRVELAPTQPLPSYLIAFAVGPFDAIDAGKTKSGAPVRVLVTRGHHAAYAASTAARLVDQLETWTGIPYAYGKLDLVAVPRSGSHWAAMENPGLVTFADWIVRGDDSREAKREWVAIASHEFAHQWFGDLVTMAWWNDIWLNESFAVYLAREMVAEFDPVWAEAPRDAYFDRVTVARPALEESYEASSLLAYFSGGRGARSLGMFKQLLGDGFRAAIHDYLVAHAHRTATTADLIAALQAHTTMRLDRAGLAAIDAPPEAKLEIHLACGDGPAAKITSKTPALAPVCVAYDRDGARAMACTILDGSAATIALPAKACPAWLVPNAGAAMLYATRRTSVELDATVDRAWGKLDESERAAILDELGADLGMAFRLADVPDAKSWAAQAMARTLRVVPADLRPRVDAWIRKTYLPRAKRIQLAAASHEEAAILELVSFVRDPDLERAAAALANGPADLDTAVLRPVLRMALRADPKLEKMILDMLNRAYFERRRALLDVLAELPAIESSNLTIIDRLVMAAASCDPGRRAEVQRLAGKLSDNADPILRDMNACLDARPSLIELWRRRVGK